MKYVWILDQMAYQMFDVFCDFPDSGIKVDPKVVRGG